MIGTCEHMAPLDEECEHCNDKEDKEGEVVDSPESFLVPKEQRNRERAQEIVQAMLRCLNADMDIPTAWIAELEDSGTVEGI
jgi:hypothetical protein